MSYRCGDSLLARDQHIPPGPCGVTKKKIPDLRDVPGTAYVPLEPSWKQHSSILILALIIF